MGAMKVDGRVVVSAVLAMLVAAGLVVRGPFVHGRAVMPSITLGGVDRPEGCLRCHADVQGLGPAHDPRALGCSTCHLGDPTALDEADAHRGMELLAGDLSTVGSTCGRTECHADEATRVVRSVMAGAPGLLAVNSFAFGERASPEPRPDDDLRMLARRGEPRSPAESHVRKLCGSCHLGLRKTAPGDEGFFSRGGGCTACHLAKPWALEAGGTGRVHPDVSAAVREERCAGCHSRSGRIAMSFRGVVEVEPGDERVVDKLPDGRPVGRELADVHARGGMTCIDCHTERDLMGDGHAHLQGYLAVDIRCSDCHGPKGNEPMPVGASQAAVARVLQQSWRQRGMPPLPPGPPLTTRAGTPLWRTDSIARTQLLSGDGAERKIPEASEKAYHTLRGHERLSCQACHSGWAPRCAQCHTKFDEKGTQIDHLTGQSTPGEWIEVAGGNGYGPPVLAIGPRGAIDPFVEGMTMTIEGIGRRLDRVLWAPLEPHTTGESRACASCHPEGSVESIYPSTGETTRVKARLLDSSERERVWQVGQCVRCHNDYDDVIYGNFTASVERLRAHRAGESGAGAKLRRCGGRVGK